MPAGMWHGRTEGGEHEEAPLTGAHKGQYFQPLVNADRAPSFMLTQSFSFHNKGCSSLSYLSSFQFQTPFDK